MHRDFSTIQRETLCIDELARRLGINRATAHGLARRDRLPVPFIRLGRRMVASHRALDHVLDGHHAPFQNEVQGAGKGVMVDAK